MGQYLTTLFLGQEGVAQMTSVLLELTRKIKIFSGPKPCSWKYARHLDLRYSSHPTGQTTLARIFFLSCMLCVYTVFA